MAIISLLFSLFYIVLYTFVFLYIRELERTGCDCSKDWKRDFIYIYICLIVPIFVIRIFLKVPGIITSVMAMLTLFFIGVVYFYIEELKKKKCECSVSDTRKVLEIVNYIQIGLIAIIFIMMLFSVFTIGTSQESSLIKPSKGKTVKSITKGKK